MTPGCRKPSFQFMVVFLVCFVNDRVRLRLPCQAPPVAIARAATQRRRRAANKKLQRNATGQATLHAIAQRMKKLASRSEEHTSELQSLMRISYAVFCLKKKNIITYIHHTAYYK